MGRPKGSKGKKNKMTEIIGTPKDCNAPVPEEAKKEIEKIELTKEQKERQDKLNTVLRDLNKKNPGSVTYANEIEVKGRQSVGYKCLDNLTGGGIIMGNCSV